MKNYNLSAFLIAILTFASGGMLQAQYDDLYFDPDTDANYSYEDYDNNYSSDDYYEEDSYSEIDDEPYDYYYTSRIRRFHRPYYGFNYFDPVYVDMAYYDPFIRPSGVTVLIYDDYYGRNSWNSWRRYNRWNSWNRYNVWNNWAYPYSGYNRWNSWNSWGSPYGYSPYGYNNLGYNSWGGVGYAAYGGGFGNYYCPPSWGNGNVYNNAYNVSNNSQGTYSGPRRSGTVATPRSTTRTVDDNLSQGSSRNTISRNGAVDARAPRTTTNSGTLERHTIRSGGNVERSNANTRSAVTPNRSIDRSGYSNSRAGTTTTRPSINSRTRSTVPNRSYDRSTTPSRSYNTSPSRSYSPSRSTTPSRSYNTSPSRSMSPSPSRSVSPSRSSGSSINRSSTPSRSSSSGSSSGRTRSGGGEK